MLSVLQWVRVFGRECGNNSHSTGCHPLGNYYHEVCSQKWVFFFFKGNYHIRKMCSAMACQDSALLKEKKKITFMILGDSLLQIQLIESKHCSFTHFIFFSFKPTDKLIAVIQKRTEPLTRPLDRPAGSPVSPLCLHLGSQSMTGWLSPLALL